MKREEFEEVCDLVMNNIIGSIEKKPPLSVLLAWGIYQSELTDYLFSGSDEITIEPDKEV